MFRLAVGIVQFCLWMSHCLSACLIVLINCSSKVPYILNIWSKKYLSGTCKQYLFEAYPTFLKVFSSDILEQVPSRNIQVISHRILEFYIYVIWDKVNIVNLNLVYAHQTIWLNFQWHKWNNDKQQRRGLVFVVPESKAIGELQNGINRRSRLLIRANNWFLVNIIFVEIFFKMIYIQVSRIYKTFH